MRRSTARTLAGMSIAGALFAGAMSTAAAGAATNCAVHVKSVAVCVTNGGGRHASAVVLNYPQNSNALAGAGVYCSNGEEHLVVVIGLWGTDEAFLPACLP